MKLNNIIISASVVAIGLLSINAVYKGEPKDTLDKRKFIVSMTEVKDGSPPKKGVEDELEFKGGKFFSVFLDLTFQYFNFLFQFYHFQFSSYC